MKRQIFFALSILVIGLRCVAAESSAVSDFKATVGPESWNKLITRLNGVNQDILTKGLRDFPGASGMAMTTSSSPMPLSM